MAYELLGLSHGGAGPQGDRSSSFSSRLRKPVREGGLVWALTVYTWEAGFIITLSEEPLHGQCGRYSESATHGLLTPEYVSWLPGR